MQIKAISIFNILKHSPKVRMLGCLQTSDSISFSGCGPDGSRMRSKLGGMNCPCCGIKMLTGRDIKHALALPPEAPSKDVIPHLKKYEDSMHSVEKATFQLLENLGKKHPNNNLRQLLDTVRNNHLTQLHEDEMKVIERIRAVGHYLSDNSKKSLNKTLKEAEELIQSKNYDETFKRRVFIGKIGDAVANIPEKDAGDTIFAIAHEIPRAGTSRDAFVVKYTENNSRNKTDRNSHDIIRGLLAPSLGTIEHIKARSKIVEKGGGANNMNNYLLECANDNNMRSCMPFWTFVRENPHFYGEHLQKYIDAIITRLNNGELQGFERYPLQIARTLRRQSKGKIKLDISALKLPEKTNNNYNKSKKS